MSPVELAGWALALYWIGFTLNRLRTLGKLPLLPALAELPAVRRRVSVVLAARDERERIRGTVERLAAQQGVELEVIVVDDRSTDGTGEIVDELAAQHATVRALHVRELPAGWLGKTHALEVGAREAAGEWILFTDADAWFAPDLVARAVATAERDGVAQLCLNARQDGATFFCHAALNFFILTFSAYAARVNRDAPASFVGIGAFNLVRASAYRAAGGHEPLRLEVVDDLKLGFILWRSGHRCRFYDAMRELAVHWASTVPGILRALEKNAFALFGYRVSLALAASLLPLALWLATLAVAIDGTLAGRVALSALAVSALPAVIDARRSGQPWLPALICPWMLPVMPATILWSTALTLSRGGIRWRKTFHSLDELRRGRVGWGWRPSRGANRGT